MRVTDFTRSALAVRRERRDMTASGWELLDPGSNLLLSLINGARFNQEITDVRIATGRKALWVKIEKRDPK